MLGKMPVESGARWTRWSALAVASGRKKKGIERCDR
jgi:hypothetical protein